MDLMTVEDALNEIREKVAMLGFFMKHASIDDDDAPPAEAYLGIATVCLEVAQLARATIDALDAGTLGTELPYEEEGDDGSETEDVEDNNDDEGEE